MSESSSVFQLVLIDHIRSSPHQARKAFDPESLRSLADSLQQEGLIQPITVRIVSEHRRDGVSVSNAETPTQFELVSGERRLRAAKLLGWKSIEAKVIQVISEGEAAAKGLIENLQREDLNPIEEAEGFAELNRVDSSYWTQEKIAQIAGKSRSYVTQSLSLLSLPDPIQEDVRRRTYSRAHAIELGRLSDPAAQLKAARQIKLTKMSREKTRQWVDILSGVKAKPAPDSTKDSTPDPLASFWPEFVANPWLGPEDPIKVKYLGELRWSFDLPGPKLPSDITSGSEIRTRLRKALGELMIRMGRSISYGEQGPLMNPAALGDRQVPRAPHRTIPETPSSNGDKARLSPAEEMDHIELARLPQNETEMREVMAEAAKGVAAFYRWVYGKESAIARESEDLSWQELGTNAQQGPAKILERLRDLQSRV